MKGSDVREQIQKLLVTGDKRLLIDVVAGGGGARRRVRPREARGRAKRFDDPLLVGRVDEDSGLGRDELGRAADGRRDDAAAGRHRLEEGLPERLDQRRLAHDVRLGKELRDLVVADRSREDDAGAAFELRAERAVADERERSLIEALEGARQPEDVLARRQRADVEEAGRAVGSG